MCKWEDEKIRTIEELIELDDRFQNNKIGFRKASKEMLYLKRKIELIDMISIFKTKFVRRFD